MGPGEQQYGLSRLERFSEEEHARILRALEFATRQHGAQRRISGEPFIMHPVAVAQSLIDDFSADADTVIAGLLHDTVEDTGATLDGIESEFGPAVRFIVDGTTDVGRGDGQPFIEDRLTRDAATHRKVDEYAAKDPRIYLVKLADRWHNMKTCGAMRPNSRTRLANETLSFHVPIARKLGYGRQADEIQRVCEEVLEKIKRWGGERASRRRYLS